MRHSTEQRRLLAVLVADIVGYSRLMAENEADTFYRLKDFQGSLITPTTERNHGHIVKWTGDGFIAAFDSAVDAVRAAVEIQSGVAAAGAATPDDRRIRFRIGINAGDVILVPGDVYGDTVNIAARLETLAAPGGVCISRGVRDTVRGKFSVEFEDRGELAVKNIPDPVGTFSVIFDPIAWTMGRDEMHPTPRRGWVRYAVAAGIVLLVAAAAGAAWYVAESARNRPPSAAVTPRPAAPATAPPQAASAPPSASATPSAPFGAARPAASPLRVELTARLASAAPKLSERAREERARDYEGARGHKAQAVSADPVGTWRATGRPTVEDAEAAALEQCQIFYGEPCVLLAVDDIVLPAPAGSNWSKRDMPRSRYAGVFEPEQIPGAGPGVRGRTDIVGYRSAANWKAAAYHASGGRVFTVVGAANQRAAEEQALQTCNTDPSRGGRDGPCFLYAIGEQVVLPRRLRDPASLAVPLRDALTQRLALTVPKLVESTREAQARQYEAEKGHKALAASPDPPGTWRSSRPSAVVAEAAALESCQVYYGQPCILIAVGNQPQSAPDNGDWPRRDMPRVRYAGIFDPGQIPALRPDLLERPDIAGYRSSPAPKAAAYHPWGRVFTATGAVNQRAAEQQALEICNADPSRNGREGSCFLYAVGDAVVLPRRLKGPLTPPP